LCSKMYTCHALYCDQFLFLYRHPLEPC
jgi:hypothetical protein